MRAAALCSLAVLCAFAPTTVYANDSATAECASSTSADGAGDGFCEKPIPSSKNKDVGADGDEGNIGLEADSSNTVKKSSRSHGLEDDARIVDSDQHPAHQADGDGFREASSGQPELQVPTDEDLHAGDDAEDPPGVSREEEANVTHSKDLVDREGLGGEDETDKGVVADQEVTEDDDEMADIASYALDNIPSFENVSRCSLLSAALAHARTLDGRPVATVTRPIQPGVDDIVVLVSVDKTASSGRVTALSSETGELRWRTLLPSASVTQPAYSVDRQLIYILTNGWMVYALSTVDGSVAWSFTESSGAFIAPPAVGVNSLLYVGNIKGVVYALHSKTGQLVWTRDLAPMAIVAQPVPTVVLNAAVVVVGLVRNVPGAGSHGDGDNLFCLDALNGTSVWRGSFAGDIVNTPLVSLMKHLIVSALQADGQTTVFMITPGAERPVWTQSLCGNVSLPAHVTLDNGLASLLVLCSNGVGVGIFVEEGKYESRVNLTRKFGRSCEVLTTPVPRQDMIFFMITTSGVLVQLGINSGRVDPLMALSEPSIAAPLMGPYGYIYIAGYNGMVMAQEMSDVEATWTVHLPGHIVVSPILL
eukprot:scpid58930/ scgid20679/ 